MKNPETAPLPNEEQGPKEETRIEDLGKAEVMAEAENRGRYWVGEYRKYLEDPEAYKNSMHPGLLDNITPCFRGLNEAGITPEKIEEQIDGASEFAGEIYDFERELKEMTIPELRVAWLRQWANEKITEQKRQWTWSGKRHAPFQPINPDIKTESDSYRKASKESLLALRKKNELRRELERRKKKGVQEEE